MADKPVHGDPMPMPSYTKEPEVATEFRIAVRPVFVLDLSEFGGPVVPFNPTPRMMDRVVRTITHGNPGEIEPPENPKPNGYPQIPPTKTE